MRTKNKHDSFGKTYTQPLSTAAPFFLPPRNDTIMFDQLTNYCDYAKAYFTDPTVDADELRLRLPPEPVADPASLFHHDYSDFQVLLNTSKPPQKQSPCLQHFKKIGSMMHDHQYQNVLDFYESLIPQIPIANFYSFIASIICGDDEQEFKSYLEIERPAYNPGDLMHYTHLLDELITLSRTKKGGLLLKLILDNDTSLRDKISARPHPIPPIPHSDKPRNVIQSEMRLIKNNSPFNNANKAFDKAMDDAAVRMPTLIATAVPVSGQVTEKPYPNLQGLIATGQNEYAIQVATSCLKTKSKQSHMLYLHRAIAETKCSMFQNAINDCTAAIDLKPDFLPAYQVRASLWMQIGEISSAINDLLKIVDKTELAKINDGAIHSCSLMDYAKCLMAAYKAHPISSNWINSS